MKIAAYEVRPDEKPVIEGLCKKYGIELISTPANLDKTTANMAAGCDGVTTLGQSDYCNAVLDELKGYGVKVLASRCVGYNHMNCDYARSLGFRLCNGAYAPNGVAEYTVMAILMCIRKFKKALYNTNDNDFTLKGKMGRELRTMTVGVMGTGKIGFTASSVSAASAAVSWPTTCIRTTPSASTPSTWIWTPCTARATSSPSTPRCCRRPPA